MSEYWLRAETFDPTDAEEHDALVRLFSEGEECSNPAWLVQDGGFPEGDPLENAMSPKEESRLDAGSNTVPEDTTLAAATMLTMSNLPRMTPNAMKLAVLEAKLAVAERETLGTQTFSKGTVMCFMLPKNTVTPTKLVYVYGKLAHDLTSQSRIGTCIL